MSAPEQPEVTFLRGLRDHWQFILKGIAVVAALAVAWERLASRAEVASIASQIVSEKAVSPKEVQEMLIGPYNPYNTDRPMIWKVVEKYEEDQEKIHKSLSEIQLNVALLVHGGSKRCGK